jgi:hypothetical protein
VLEAALRADALLDQGDVKGSAIWRRIVGIINTLGSPPKHERMH